MVSVDVSLVFQIVNFLFLIWILNLVLYRPIRKVLIQRKEKVDGLEERIETFESDASSKDQAFSAGLRKARAKGLEEKEARVAEATAQEKEIIAQINAKAQENLAAVRAEIARDAETARAALQKEVDGFATAIGEKILGRAI